MNAEVKCKMTLGRYYLIVNGVVVALEGERCSDPDIPQNKEEKELNHCNYHRWTEEDFRRICGSAYMPVGYGEF